MNCNIDKIRNILAGEGLSGKELDDRVEEYKQLKIQMYNDAADSARVVRETAYGYKANGEKFHKIVDILGVTKTTYGYSINVNPTTKNGVDKIDVDSYGLNIGNGKYNFTKGVLDRMVKENAEHGLVDGTTLYNQSGTTQEYIDRAFMDADTTNDTVHNIQLAMQKADQEALGGDWDAEHSEALKGVTTELQRLSKTIAGMNILVTKDKVASIVEPIGEFNPNATDNKIRLIRGSLGEEARNKFTMTNEEAMTHELVHAALDWIFHTTDKTVGQALKLQIRGLYKYASKVVTVEDFMPEHKGVYTNIEKQKAQARYDYIFGTNSEIQTVADADARLQEFMAHAMTNKALGYALSQKLPENVLREKVDGENLLETLSRWIWNAFQIFVTKAKKIKGENLLEETTKLVYAMTAVQDRYASKATQMQGMPLDEKIMGMVNKQTDKLDALLGKPVDWILEKTVGEDTGTISPRSKHTKAEIDKIIRETPGLTAMSLSNDPVIQMAYKSEFIREWVAEEVDAGRRMEAAIYVNKLGEALAKNAPKPTDGYIKQMYKAATTLKNIRHMNKVMKRTINNEGLANVQSKLLQQMGLGEGSFAAAVMADFVTGRTTLVQAADMTMQFRAHIDRLREKNFEGTLEDIVNGFTKIKINDTKNKKYREALESAVLSIDLQSVGLDIGIDGLTRLVNSDDVIDAEITKIVGELAKVGEYASEMWQREAKSVAQFMVTGTGLRSNARNIVNMYGHAQSFPEGIGNPYSDREQVIDKLITLYALKEAAGRAELAELLEQDPDGVRNYMETARGMIRSTEEEMEAGGEHENFVKGQTNDRLDPNKDIQYAPMYNRVDMEAQGYAFVKRMEIALGDFDKTAYGMFYSNNAGIGKRVDGAVSLQRRNIPGLLLSDKVRMSNPHLKDKALWDVIAKEKKKAIDVYRNKGDVSMQPVYSPLGDIQDFRYVISKEDKVSKLDMSVNGVEKLGRSFGQVGTMTMTNEQNRNLIDIIRKDSAERDTSSDMYKNNAHLYIKIQPKEFDMTDEERVAAYKHGTLKLEDKGKYGFKTEGEELWGLLPPDARNYIIEKNREEDWKSNKDENIRDKRDIKPRRELYVRRDLINQLFAYNEPSIMDIKKIGKIPLKVSAKVDRNVRLAENYFKAFVAVLKSNVVVKMPSTIYGNILSNAKFLVYSGMSPRQAIDNLSLSRKSLKQWKADEVLQHRYERLIASTEGNERGKYKRLRADTISSMNANPLKPLMDAGLFQSVVEGVSLREDDNNVVSNAIEKQVIKVVPQGTLLHEVVQTVFLTKKSALGRFMVGVTQESDFHFRAATYWHGIAKGIPEAEIMSDVKENFINYSKVINSKFVQWLDRMGPEAFWKYWANIQRVQINRLRKNTFKVLMDVAAQKVGLSPDAGIYHSNIFQSLGRRLSPIDSMTNLFRGGSDAPIFNFFG